MPPAPCDPAATPADGGASPDAAPDPFAVPARCTSGTNWTGGLRESPLMQPGEPCVACHAKPGEAPKLSFGGTVYPSAHEPSQCNGANGTSSAQGAEVVLVDAAGMTFTAKVNAAGNFYASARTPVTPPLKAKVVFMGRERVMIAAVPSGDCNACHTQKGTTTLTTPMALAAPGPHHPALDAGWEPIRSGWRCPGFRTTILTGDRLASPGFHCSTSHRRWPYQSSDLPGDWRIGQATAVGCRAVNPFMAGTSPSAGVHGCHGRRDPNGESHQPPSC
jgi:hypothetical protein